MIRTLQWLDWKNITIDYYLVDITGDYNITAYYITGTLLETIGTLPWLDDKNLTVIRQFEPYCD